MKIKGGQRKFDDFNQLYEAYCELEREFTKRCQLASELKKQLDTAKQLLSQKYEISLSDIPQSVKTEIIGEYLDGLASVQRVATLGQNVGKMTLAPEMRPKNLAEAHALAQKMIKGE